MDNDRCEGRQAGRRHDDDRRGREGKEGQAGGMMMMDNDRCGGEGPC